MLPGGGVGQRVGPGKGAEGGGAEAHGAPTRSPLPTPAPQAGLKYWGPSSPTHKLPRSFAGDKDGEGRCGRGRGHRG